MKKIEDMNYKELCELSENIQKFKYSFIDITKLKIVEGHLCKFTIDGNLSVWGERTGIKYYDIFGDFSMNSTFFDNYPYFRTELSECGVATDPMVSRKKLRELWDFYCMTVINKEDSNTNKR